MRIGDLSQRTGIPVPTIKYYLREGLLSYGRRLGPNQVRYDESHERRLRLVRALTEVGGLSVAAARSVLDAVDEPDRSAFKTLGVVHHAVSGDQDAAERIDRAGPESSASSADSAVDDLLARHGWRVGAGNPARPRLAELLTVLSTLDRQELIDRLDDYAGLAEQLARIDMDVVLGAPDADDTDTDGDAVLENLAVSTVLADALVAALRHLAQTHVARQRVEMDGY